MRGHNGDCSQATTVAAARNFDNSYEAYQMKAMNAIQALDDAVANETGSETEQMVAPPAPPAPPPLPPGEWDVRATEYVNSFNKSEE